MLRYAAFLADQRDHTSKRKIKPYSIQRNLQVLKILLRKFPDIFEVYAKRIRISLEEKLEMDCANKLSPHVNGKGVRFKNRKNKDSHLHKRVLLLEFHCRRHIPISRIRHLELSLKRILRDLFGDTVYFIFIRLSIDGTYKRMSQTKEKQNAYKSSYPLGLRIFQRYSLSANKDIPISQFQSATSSKSLSRGHQA